MRSLKNLFLYECLFTLTFWNSISLSVGNEHSTSVFHYLPEDYSDNKIKSLPLLNKNSHKSRASSDWVVIQNTTESLSLSEIKNKDVNKLIALLSNFKKGSRLQYLTLSNISVNWIYFVKILQTIWHSSIEYVNVNSMTQLSNIVPYNFDYSGTSMKALTMKKVLITSLYFTQDDIYKIFSDMNIASLTIAESEMIHMLCPSYDSPFKYLNFLKNDLTDLLFQSCETLIHLEKLILGRNKFKSLFRVSLMTSHMQSLSYLDMSSNMLHYDGAEEHCQWADSLTELDLSSNQLTESVFECLPVNIKRLDLQNNQIASVPKGIAELQSLRELNLASNRLSDLPGCSSFPALAALNIEMNSILAPSTNFVASCQRVGELRAGHNPFKCSCELRAFIRLERQSGGKLWGWPEAYVCQYPDDLRGTELKDFHVSELSCNTTLLLVIALLVTLVLVAVVAFLCIYFDAPWYIRMTWQWTQTKRRAWHEYKLIFVLSPNFVQSEWCHYELYFAHHKLFSDSSDSLILILLEPIPPYIIPARYHKLKALMAKRTYLEWPKERSKHALFWANLRAAISINLPMADGHSCGECN
ncbi:PREDICTED: LOW QUALITY PROTEIN: toll-like receptor 1 [Tinamus guttatus]|uniref:LOW QUALITY PROTEIN: toll-like receptor 1 n=1 Tax=Tinamus guttatus TaxID=94827 RepID=UPI00052F18BC|nr:PREDICTED: LOW QUALITY PROTEIN: toll-like receptor 1 [Tinamus guttatus]